MEVTLINRKYFGGGVCFFFRNEAILSFFSSLPSSDRAKFLVFSKKKKKEKSSEVGKPFLCRIRVSVVDSFSHFVLLSDNNINQLFCHIDCVRLHSNDTGVPGLRFRDYL